MQQSSTALPTALPTLSTNQCGKRLSCIDYPGGDGRLYLGNAQVAKDTPFLQEFGFQAVLSVGGGKSGEKPGFIFKHVGVKDCSDDPLLPHFGPCCDFIKDQLANSIGRVLVHCRAGVHRSPCVLAAFLIREQGASVEDALKIVKASRASVRFADYQINQLALFHEHCKNGCLMTPSFSPSPPDELSALSNLSYTFIERDLEDDRYIVSFHVDDTINAKAFFERYGFVVFREVLSKEECLKTRQEMWSIIENENPGLTRQDSSTWHKWSSSFGMPKQKVIFSPQICKNRCNLKIHRAFATVLGTNHLMLNHDRFTIYRPTERGPDGRQFGTRTNLHLDIDPWQYLGNDSGPLEALRYTELQDFIRENNAVVQATGPHVQAILNLRDNVEADGGTQVIPGFHKVFEEWANSTHVVKQKKSNHEKKVLGGNYKLNPNLPLNKLGQRVTMREGSIVIWDQRLMHGSVENRSKRLRMAQFMKAFPTASILTEGRRRARSLAVHNCLKAEGLDEWARHLGKKECEMLGL